MGDFNSRLGQNAHANHKNVVDRFTDSMKTGGNEKHPLSFSPKPNKRGHKCYRPRTSHSAIPNFYLASNKSLQHFDIRASKEVDVNSGHYLFLSNFRTVVTPRKLYGHKNKQNLANRIKELFLYQKINTNIKKSLERRS